MESELPHNDLYIRIILDWRSEVGQYCLNTVTNGDWEDRIEKM